MSRRLPRVLGYAVPTVTIVLALHVVREASVGEAIDGLVSGLVFVACFALGSVLSDRMHGPRPERRVWDAAREGLLLGVGAWLALWAFWNTPVSDPLRASSGLTFAFNLLVNAAAGFVRLPKRGERRLALL